MLLELAVAAVLNPPVDVHAHAHVDHVADVKADIKADLAQLKADLAVTGADLAKLHLA